MRNIWLIAARDYNAAVRTKSFVVGLLFLPTMMLGSVVVQWLLLDKAKEQPQRVAIVDRSPAQVIAPVVEAAISAESAENQPKTNSGRSKHRSYRLERIEPGPNTQAATEHQRLELSARVRSGEFDGFLEIGPEILSTTPSLGDDHASVRYQTRGLGFDGFARLAIAAIAEFVQTRRAAQLGLPLDKLKTAQAPVPFNTVGLSRRDPATGAVTEADEQNRMIAILVPIGLVLLMFMMVLTGSTPLLQSVAEEKAYRIAELLLSSVRPFELMAGKLLGNIGVGLTTVTLYLVAATLAAHRFGFDEYISPMLLGWFLVFQVLGILIYGSLYMAVGAACNDAKQMQTFMMPIMLLAVSPLFALGALIQNPHSPLAARLSFVPFATPMMMIFRISIPPGIVWWQPAIGAGIMLITAAACVFAAGRVMRLGLLMQGKGPNLREMLKWVVRG
jgi:ABC-2 type transport system permease protein